MPDGNGGISGRGGGGGGGSYPNAPPAVRFVTRICAANVGFEVCFVLFFMCFFVFCFFTSHFSHGGKPGLCPCLRGLCEVSWGANALCGSWFADDGLDRGDMFGSIEDGVDAGVYAQDDGRGDLADAGCAGDR